MGTNPPKPISQCGSSDNPEKTIVTVTNETDHVFICALFPAIRATTPCTNFRCSILLYSSSAIPTVCRDPSDGSSRSAQKGVVHFLWLGGCEAASPPIEEVGPAPVFEAASGGEHGVGARFRPVAPGSFEPTSDDALAGAFHDAGSDRQAAPPVEVAAHPVHIGLAGADAGRDRFEPAVPLQSGDDVTTGLKLPKSAEVKFPSQGAANSFRGHAPRNESSPKSHPIFLPKEARVG